MLYADNPKCTTLELKMKFQNIVAKKSLSPQYS